MESNAYHKIIKKLRDLPGGKKGLWISNLSLKKTFKAGDAVFKKFINNELIIEKSIKEFSNHTISYRKSDKNITPILDIKSQEFSDFFKDSDIVEIDLYENKIIVKKSEHQKNKDFRENTNELTTFELFCGGGTMTQMFNQNGFISVGGLELNEKYLSIFEKNNEYTKITINSSLEHVNFNDYPKNVSTLLAGIPCTKLSGSNVQMIEAQKLVNNGTATQEQIELVESKKELNLLVYKVVEAAVAMNVKTVVVEEVTEFSSTEACNMLRTMLSSLGYKLSETVSEGSNTKRKRWTLIANTGSEINLDNLIIPTKTISECINKNIEDIKWKTIEDIPRLSAAIKKSSVGLRANSLYDTKSNTFTTHCTRHTEPAIKHPYEDLYAEFTNDDIANIHGLKNFMLSGVKTIDRQILGQGVTDMFSEIAKRIKNNRLNYGT